MPWNKLFAWRVSPSTQKGFLLFQFLWSSSRPAVSHSPAVPLTALGAQGGWGQCSCTVSGMETREWRDFNLLKSSLHRQHWRWQRVAKCGGEQGVSTALGWKIQGTGPREMRGVAGLLKRGLATKRLDSPGKPRSRTWHRLSSQPTSGQGCGKQLGIDRLKTLVWQPGCFPASKTSPLHFRAISSGF